MNLGRDTYAAVQELRKHGQWEAFLNGMEALASQHMNSAIESGEKDACGYAKAVRDMFIAFASASKDVRVHQVKKPGVPAQAKE